MVYQLVSNGDVPDETYFNDALMKQAVIVCTSGTRPAGPPEGMTIYETDTKLHMVYDGAAWVCPYSPAYVDYSANLVCYSNAAAGTTISAASVSVTYAKYQKVGTRCHYFGHVYINTTTANGFGISLPFNSPYRSFSLSHIVLHGDNAYNTSSFGSGHCPNTTAPFNRVSPASNTNAILNITSSGCSAHWNILYECV